MNTEDIETLQSLKTPFYYYDTRLLRDTLQRAVEAARQHDFILHYAIKANANPKILDIIQSYGIGADCVSGNEIFQAVKHGFPSQRIVYAGVGKNDDEILLALKNNIFCFNCESLPEIEVINTLAGELGKKASIALRVNPNVDAHTHHYITTGMEENKFGFYLHDLEHAVRACREMENIQLIGLHFHIGSQITDLSVFQKLCQRVNDIQRHLKDLDITLPHVNFGGGLGINYDCPTCNPIPDFASYFQIFTDSFERQAGQQVHFELGRSLVGQAGSLISRVLYVKEGQHKKFVILDAGMNDLLRPALYQAFHHIENLTSNGVHEKYDIVGPICESSDCFGKDRDLPSTKRGDLIAIRSCGAYGEAMASHYNLRELPGSYFSNPS